MHILKVISVTRENRKLYLEPAPIDINKLILVGKRIPLPHHKHKSRAAARHRRNRPNRRARNQPIKQLPIIKEPTSPPPLSPSFSTVSQPDPFPDIFPSFRTPSPIDFDPTGLRLACFREPSPQREPLDLTSGPRSRYPQTREAAVNFVNTVTTDYFSEIIDDGEDLMDTLFIHEEETVDYRFFLPESREQ